MSPLEQAHVALSAVDISLLLTEQVKQASPKRDLTPEEEEQMAQEQRKILPRIFSAMEDNPARDMSSPLTPAILLGLIGSGYGGALGALSGDAATHAMGGDGTTRRAGMVTGGVLGALAGGLGLGGMGYMTGKRRNEAMEDMIRRAPEGSTRGDMLARPAAGNSLFRGTMLGQGV